MRIIVCLFFVLTVCSINTRMVEAQENDLRPRVGYGPGFYDTSVVFSPDGTYLATGRTLWDVRTGRPVRAVQGTIFSPDGKFLADYEEDFPGSRISLFEAGSGNVFLQFKTEQKISSLVFSPDGKYLAGGGQADFLGVWETETGKKINSFSNLHRHPNPFLYYFYAVAFSPSGKILASGGTDQTVDLWNSETGEKIRSLEGHSANIFELEFSPDGQKLASADGDGRILIREVRTGQKLAEINNHTGRVWSLSFSPDGRHLISTGDIREKVSPREKTTENSGERFEKPGGAVNVWDVANGRESKVIRLMDGVGSVDYSPDGKLIAGFGSDKTVRLWDAETGREVRKIEDKREKISSLKLSPDQKTLFVAGEKASYSIGLDQKNTIKRLPPKNGNDQIYDTFALTPDGKSIIRFFGAEYGAKDSDNYSADYRPARLVFYDVDTLKQTRKIDLGRSIISVKYYNFIKNGKILVLTNGFGGGGIILVDPESGKILKKIEPFEISGNDNPVTPPPVFTPDHSEMITWGDGGDIKIWSVDSGRLLRTFKDVNSSFISSLAISPGGKTLAVGDFYGKVVFLDLATGKKSDFPDLEKIRGVCSMVFSPDGKNLATLDKLSVRLWKTATGEEIKDPQIETWMKFSCEIYSVDFDVEVFELNRKMIRAEYDREIRLKDLATGKLIATFTIINQTDWVVMTPDGRFDGTPGGLKEIYLTDGKRAVEINAEKHKGYLSGLLPKILLGAR